RRSCGPRARRPHAPRFLAGRRGGVRGASARHRDSRRRGRSAARKLRGGVVMDDRERVWRAEFPITDRLNYLNNCSLIPLHRRGRERIERYLGEWTELGGRAWYDHWIGEYESFREDLAGMLGASVDEIAIEPNVSAGLVGIASTFDYAKRPKVIVSDLDFPTDGHAFLAVADRGARVEFVRSPDRVRVPGIAFLYARGSVAERARPSAVGWWGVKEPFAFDVEHLDYGAGARRFEYGTPAVAAIYAARAGLELLAEVGIATVRERHKLLSQRLVEGAVDQGWTIRCPRDPEERTPIVTLEHPDPASAVTALRTAGLICDNRPGLIRLSPHYFNTLEEMDRALALLEPLRVAHAVA